jgi:hypothetical protein
VNRACEADWECGDFNVTWQRSAEETRVRRVEGERLVIERRYQVFVSSTFLDLKEERAAVVSALLNLDAIPAGMELFPAADDDAWTLIERVIEESDYYLLVIGGKYGSIDPQTEISFTEKEYDYAVSLKRPVMAFLHGDPGSIPFKKSEQDEQAREKLAEFRKKVESSKHVKFWTSASDLQGRVAMSYASFQKRYPAVGWIRGDVQTSTESLSELNELRKKLDASEKRLEAARTSPPPGTEELSQGKDEAVLAVNLSGRVYAANDKYGKSHGYLWHVRPTWDDVFSAVGPRLLDEAEEKALRRSLDSWLDTRFRAEAKELFKEIILNEHELVRDIDIKVQDEPFGTLLVQLRALGLITRSERKRSVNDRGTYWALTPYGDDHLTTLRAISREAASEARERAANSLPGEENEGKEPAE